MANPTTFSGRTNYELFLSVTESSASSSTNSSGVSWSLIARVRTTNGGTYNNFGDSGWSVNVNGTAYSGSWSYDFRYTDTITIASNSLTVAHLADGSKTISYSGSADGGSGSLGSASVSDTLALTNFVLPPQKPSAPSVTRASTGATISATGTAPSSSVTITSYKWQYSATSSTGPWTAISGTTSTPVLTNWAVPSNITGYWISFAATSSEGTGSYSTGSFIAGVPDRPATIAATRTARSVAVTITSSASTGGATITAYKVQRSSDGTTWTDLQDITSGTYTYTLLAPATTWFFRAYATNSTGNSLTANSSGVFVPAGGKLYNTNTAGAWATAQIARRFDGNNWVDLQIARRWDGTNWVDLS